MKKLAIVGTGTKTRENAPFADRSFDIWTFNEAPTALWMPRWDAVFQMHPRWNYTGENRKYARYWEWLQQPHGKPVYMQAVDPLVPDSVAYPLQAAIDLVGIKYLTSTITYALALAKLQGYERVDIYGIEMSDTEYQYQAECYRFWLGYLKGAGIGVNLCSGMPLFDSLLYGYEGAVTFEEGYFAQRAAELEAQWKLAESNAKAHKRDVEKILEADKTLQLPSAVMKYHEAAMAYGVATGALSVAEHYAAQNGKTVDRGTLEMDAALVRRDEQPAHAQFLMTAGKTEYVGNVWAQTKHPNAKAQLAQFIEQLTAQAEQVGRLRGTFQENANYIQKYDKHALALGVSNPLTRAIADAEKAKP